MTSESSIQASQEGRVVTSLADAEVSSIMSESTPNSIVIGGRVCAGSFVLSIALLLVPAIASGQYLPELSKALTDLAGQIDWSGHMQGVVLRLTDEEDVRAKNDFDRLLEQAKSLEEKQEVHLSFLQRARPIGFVRPVPGAAELPADFEPARELLRQRQATLIEAVEEHQLAVVDESQLEEFVDHASLIEETFKSLYKLMEELAPFAGPYISIILNEFVRFVEAHETQVKIVGLASDLRKRTREAIEDRAEALLASLVSQERLLIRENERLRDEAERLRAIWADIQRRHAELEELRKGLEREHVLLRAAELDERQTRDLVLSLESDVELWRERLAKAQADLAEAEREVRARFQPECICPNCNTWDECTNPDHQEKKRAFKRDLTLWAQSEREKAQKRLSESRDEHRQRQRELDRAKNETALRRRSFESAEVRVGNAAREYELFAKPRLGDIYRSKADAFQREGQQDREQLMILREALDDA